MSDMQSYEVRAEWDEHSSVVMHHSAVEAARHHVDDTLAQRDVVRVEEQTVSCRVRPLGGEWQTFQVTTRVRFEHEVRGVA